jgi:hypothetical protein
MRKNKVDIINNPEYRVKVDRVKKKYPLWPLFQSLLYEVRGYDVSYKVMELRCTVRVKHKGLWYLIKVKTEYRLLLPDESDYTRVMQEFTKNVYIAQILTRVDPKLHDISQEPVFIMDTDQQEEKERLLDYFTQLKHIYSNRDNGHE